MRARSNTMTGHRDRDGADEICTCGVRHTGHICWLSRMGLFMELQHLTGKPTAVCSKCGAKANLPHNVCFPEPLGDD